MDVRLGDKVFYTDYLGRERVAFVNETFDNGLYNLSVLESDGCVGAHGVFFSEDGEPHSFHLEPLDKGLPTNNPDDVKQAAIHNDTAILEHLDQ